MIGRSTGPGAGLLVLAVMSALLLSGCQIVSRVITQHPPSPAPLGGSCVVLAVAPGEDGVVSAELLDATSSVITDRLVALGVPSMSVTQVPPDALIVTLPAGDDARWRATIERTGDLLFVPVPPAMNEEVVDGEPPPAGMDMAPIFDESGIASASVSEDQLGKPAISITLTPEAAAAFDAWVAAHFGERFAIVLDGVVVSAPSINARQFNGQAQISGPFDEQEAEDLVAALTGGRLPTTVTELAVRTAAEGPCPTIDGAP